VIIIFNLEDFLVC